jgi:glutamate:GABA antiporter
MIAAAIGFATTLTSAVLAVFPADDEPNKPLAVIKVLGLTALMIGSGALVYILGRRNLAKPSRLSS